MLLANKISFEVSGSWKEACFVCRGGVERLIDEKSVKFQGAWVYRGASLWWLCSRKKQLTSWSRSEI